MYEFSSYIKEDTTLYYYKYQFDNDVQDKESLFVLIQNAKVTDF
jgi:hypothetical protein